MADRALREGERSQRGGGDVAAAARLVAARLRSGALDPVRARVAARLGDAAAAAATGEAPARDPVLGDRVDGVLFRTSTEACARVAHAAARAARDATAPDGDEAGAALAAAAAWLAEPGPERARAAAAAAAALEPPPRLVMGQACWEPAAPEDEAERAAFLAARACAAPDRARARAEAVAAAVAAERALGAERVGAAIAAAVVPWARGEEAD